jgi:TPR repeat protein
MARATKMKKSILLMVWPLLAVLAAYGPAVARRLPDRFDAVQLRKGLAAFDRHDYTAAGLLLRSPAEHGNSNAQAVLCFLHTYGRGVPQSFREAAMWCHRSAEQGNAQGQYMLGLLYNNGHGVPENFVQAYKWLNLAAAHASGPKKEFSYRIRDSVATKMSPAQIAKAQALAIAWRPITESRDAALIAEPCAGLERCLER